MASAKESTYFSLSEKVTPQKLPYVENREMFEAVAYADGCNDEGASASPPRSADAGKEADLVGGTLLYIS